MKHATMTVLTAFAICSLEWNVTTESTGNVEADALMKPLANGKFSLDANLAEFGLTVADVLKV